MSFAAGGIFSPLAYGPFRRLFAARTIALVGSGLTTIALSLLAYDLAGGRAGIILGTALALKMIAYVTVAPVVGGFAHRIPRRTMLIGLDVARGLLVLAFVFVSSPAQVYVLIFLLSVCSAGFTPVYQATVPDLLRDSAEFTKGLALSRVSYDLESLLSPSISTLALLVVGYPVFFALNATAFFASALMIGVTPLPRAAATERPESTWFNLTFGIRSYLATPRLRGLLALCTAVSMAGAMIIVNTVVIVREQMGGSSADVALAFAATGAGSLAAAMATPWILSQVTVRSNMAAGAALLPMALLFASFTTRVPALLVAWFMAGVGMALVQTAAGKVIDASCNASDRSAFFSAHFSLTHAAWLLAYPLTGWIGALIGIQAAFAIAFWCALMAAVAGALLWPRNDPAELWHVHEAITHSHPHAHARVGDEPGEHHTHIQPAVEGSQRHSPSTGTVRPGTSIDSSSTSITRNGLERSDRHSAPDVYKQLTEDRMRLP